MHPPSNLSTRHSKATAVFRVTAGNFLEQFDFFLFGVYTTQIANVFFPATSEFASLMMTFAVFGASFLMRPLGAIVLGAYIDDVGHRNGLIVTLSIMASGTILVAFVPGYATIGLLAPALVLLGRLLQGFSAGAELGGYRCISPSWPRPAKKASSRAGSPRASRSRLSPPRASASRSTNGWAHRPSP
ncbi:MFS family permease [Paraburkholderia tropica]|uniref:Sugar transport protein n=1 Tax=Paraburkholderia tropica TaxID=92647 RepID=A0ABX5MG12_9BURK|nr:MFS family permease [Paraburkholderia tropica]MBB3005083.1 MFS family permease [Paraburkholderia tropica]MBB6323979.1 MFS family permease [Paraburkholderia tropica]PXX06220.1 sugar transport protein [Paraburkholderia tropica]PZW71977.1 sugar transport protein [Paraburkholderia tropica]